MIATGDEDPGAAPAEVRHKVPADVGNFEAVEEPEGGAARAPVTLDLFHGSVTIPKSYGVTWGFGDTQCGYGWVIDLPGRSHICISEDEQDIEVSNKADADAKLINEIFASVRGYKVRASRTSGELP